MFAFLLMMMWRKRTTDEQMDVRTVK